MPLTENTQYVLTHLQTVQNTWAASLAKTSHAADIDLFLQDRREHDYGLSDARVIQANQVWAGGGINLSCIHGKALPEAATKRHPELAGTPFEACGISIIMHTQNPFVPTVHANFRYFHATTQKGEARWWFGGGADLTPFYPRKEDATYWHSTWKQACDQHDAKLYPAFKKACDDYFYLPHRKEHRGIGGLFFDDWQAQDFKTSFALMQTLTQTLTQSYLPIVNANQDKPFTPDQKDFQRYRWGRYVEFNLLFDRGTRFGLEFGGRTEAILVSMPPEPLWRYNWQPEPDSEEAKLTAFLQPQAWI
jgi:coproporphyrinogen III oxidase